MGNLFGEYAEQIFKNSGIQITTDGRKHLGAVIGTENSKKTFLQTMVDKWVKQIQTLSDIAKTEPHVAYAAFTHGLKHRYRYMMRTLANIYMIWITL